MRALSDLVACAAAVLLCVLMALGLGALFTPDRDRNGERKP